jgi:Domain of unknown function (DUF5666)
MKRRIMIIAVAALAVAMLPLAAQADNGTGTNPTPPVKKPHVHWFAGQVTAASSSSVSVNVLWTGKHDGQLNGQTVTVALDANTEIDYGKGKSSISPGDLVGIRATADDDKTLASLTATKIHVYCNCHWIGGTISAIGSSTLSIQVARTGPYDTVLKDKDVTVQLDSSTEYVKGKDKTEISLSDLKVGDGVGVVFSASGFFKDPNFDPSSATFTAKRVHLWARKQVPPPATDANAAAGTTP